jgi:hypothetical protein
MQRGLFRYDVTACETKVSSQFALSFCFPSLFTCDFFHKEPKI